MNDVQIIWDLPDEPNGNFRHILDGHDVTIEEIDELFHSDDIERSFSRRSGKPMIFGWTSTGKYLAVIYEEVMDDPLIVYPITAFPVPPR